MNDVSYIYDCQKGSLDIKIVDNDIFLGDDLQTAISISMFSEARTALPIETNTKESISVLSGWWADSFEDQPLGSEAWIYRRAKITQETLEGLSEAYTNSLQWLIDDGVVEALTVTAVKSETIPNTIEIVVRVSKPQQQDETFKWEFAWEDVGNAI